MIKLLKRFWQEDDGVGTVEILLILAVLVAIAVVFRNQVYNWVQTLMDRGNKSVNDTSTSLPKVNDAVKAD